MSVSVEKPDTADNQQDEDEHRDHHTGYRGITCPCKKKNINSDKTIKNITMEYTGGFFKGGGGSEDFPVCNFIFKQYLFSASQSM